MAAGVDACKSCSKEFEDLKNALKCCQCENYFHGACEGVPDLRGFHMKRASWKCGPCSKNSPADPKNRKRIRGENGDMIEVDRNLIENLLATMSTLSVSVKTMGNQISTLSASVKTMESKISSVIIENKKLTAMVSTLVKEKPQSTSLSSMSTSFASATKSNLVQVESNHMIRNNESESNNESDKLFTFRVNKQVTSGDQQITAEQVKTAIKNSVAEAASAIPEEERFKLMKNRRRSAFKEKVLKSTVIGSKLTPSDGDSIQSNEILEGSERTKWIYVGRCKPTTSCEMVKKYVESNWSVGNAKCVSLFIGDETSSFKVGVPESQSADLLNPEKWPNRVAVREFVNFGRNYQRVNSTNPSRSSAGPELFATNPEQKETGERGVESNFPKASETVQNK